MKKIVVIPIIIVLLLGLLGLVYLYDEYSISAGDILTVEGEEISLSVYDGPVELNVINNNIGKYGYYEGYDNDTFKWMNSLGDKYCFMGNNTVVIMNYADARKIPSEFVTDVIIRYDIRCKLIEKHSLLSGEKTMDVLYVYDVEYIKQEIEQSFV